MAQENKARSLEDWLSDNTASVLLGVAGSALLLVLVVAVLYFCTFRAPPLNIDAATMGQVGDFFGGALNPVFSFLSMLALLVALVVQGKELRVSREELELSRIEMAKSAQALDSQNAAIEHQRFEQTFFAWLGTYRQMLEALEEVETRRRLVGPAPGTETTEYHGRRVLQKWKASFERRASIRLNDAIPGQIWTTLGGGASDELALTALPGAGWGPVASKEIQEAWDDMYRSNESQLGGLFRVLYGLIRWIDQQTPKDSDPWLYVSIARAQLSSDELHHLFFNGHTERGRKFKELANKYALFDNLEFHSAPYALIAKETPPDAEGYKPSAFNSDIARQEPR